MGNWFTDSLKWLDKSDQWVIDNVIRKISGGPPDPAGGDKAWWESGYGKSGPEGPKGGTSAASGSPKTGGLTAAVKSVFSNMGEPSNYDAARAAALALLDGGEEESGYSGSGSGYNMQAMINQINDSFNRQQQALDASKGVGASNIQNAYNQFASNIGRNYADYTGASQQAQAAMAQRVAQQIAEAQARQGELQRSAQSMGMDIGALTQQQAGNLAALQTSAGFQQDLGQRLAQVVANNQRSLEGSGELVRQGAMGNLENNYQALLGALQAAREQQIMSAQGAAFSGGGGGGGGGTTKKRTAKDVYDEVSYTDKLIALLAGEEDMGGDFAGVSTDKLMDVYAANVNGDETQQAVAAQILPYLARRTK